MRSPILPAPLSRRTAMTILGVGLISATPALAAPPRDLIVYKSPTCGCCAGWITHMRKAGFRATIQETEDLTPVRARLGVPAALASCHTGLVGGYAIEGHVPPRDVVRLLLQKPKAVGLSVPGMPIGSPGMESSDGRIEPYETLLMLDRQGRTQVFARHG